VFPFRPNTSLDRPGPGRPSDGIPELCGDSGWPPPKVCHPGRSPLFMRPFPSGLPWPSFTPKRVEDAALPRPGTSTPDLRLPEGRAPFRRESCMTCCIRLACSWNAGGPEGGVLRVKKRPELVG